MPAEFGRMSDGSVLCACFVCVCAGLGGETNYLWFLIIPIHARVVECVRECVVCSMSLLERIGIRAKTLRDNSVGLPQYNSGAERMRKDLFGWCRRTFGWEYVCVRAVREVTARYLRAKPKPSYAKLSTIICLRMSGSDI